MPDGLHGPPFREPTAGERAEVLRITGEEPPVLLAFEADGGGTAPVTCLLAAEDLVVRQGRFPR